MLPGRHAAHDDGVRPVGMGGYDGRNLHSDRLVRPLSPHLHRRARLAGSLEPTFSGYSIGKWIDEDGDGRYDVLEVETRGFKGPRAYDELGLPLHVDDQSIFRERIYLDKSNSKILHDELTTIDHALTRPWTVDKTYARNPNPRAEWP